MLSNRNTYTHACARIRWAASITLYAFGHSSGADVDSLIAHHSKIPFVRIDARVRHISFIPKRLRVGRFNVVRKIKLMELCVGRKNASRHHYLFFFP